MEADHDAEVNIAIRDRGERSAGEGPQVLLAAVDGALATLDVGLPTPDLPDDVTHPVLGLLAAVAARRHGQAAVLRVLARPERAPEAIAAFGPA